MFSLPSRFFNVAATWVLQKRVVLSHCAAELRSEFSKFQDWQTYKLRTKSFTKNCPISWFQLFVIKTQLKNNIRLSFHTFKIHKLILFFLDTMKTCQLHLFHTHFSSTQTHTHTLVLLNFFVSLIHFCVYNLKIIYI